MHPSDFFRAFVDRRFLAANMVAIASLSILLFFPTKSVIEVVLLSFFAYAVLPGVFILFFLKEPLGRYGVRLFLPPRMFREMLFFLGTFVVFSAITVVFLSETSFGRAFIQASLFLKTKENFFYFLSVLGFFLWFTALNEFFFRGFLLFLWREYFSWKSILIHGVVISFYAFLRLWVSGDFESWGTAIPPILWGIGASLVAYRTKSVFFSFCFSFFSDILIAVYILSFV